MVFSSLVFLYLFFPLCMLIYLALPWMKAKNAVLIVFSLVFYAWGEPMYIVLLLVSALINYTCGLLIGIGQTERRKSMQRLFLILAIAADLGFLAFFKYTGFLVENLNTLLHLNLNAPSVVMPIGISFYTFQALSYVIDVYRGQVSVQKSYARFLMYIALFPQLIAGPIVRYSQIEKQIENRSITSDDIFSGLTRFCVGLGKKVLIANYCGALTSQLLDGKTASLTTLAAWLGVAMYTFQIYFDFSGYSDMAIGLGRMFGFKFEENFKLPYMSTSITEFWRRWHISLSSFFRDYVYIPLGGNRRHMYLNLLIVWGLTGLWHGASWNFVLWGLYFFVLLVIEKRFAEGMKKIPAVVRYPVTLLLVMLGWVLFYFTDLADVGNTISAMFGGGTAWINTETKIRLTSSIPLLLVAALGCTPLPRGCAMVLAALCSGGEHNNRKPAAFYVLTFVFDLCLLLLATISLVGSSYNPFLYFRF